MGVICPTSDLVISIWDTTKSESAGTLHTDSTAQPSIRCPMFDWP